MPKTIDLNKTVFELVQENPELIDIMQALGFSEIAKKPILHSLGRIMTIPKGAEKKGIPLEKIIDTLQRHGFYVTENSSSENRDAQMEHLKSFLNRLSSGESLEAVRQDFARAFDEVDPLDIMLAEQSLINDGTPLAEMQKLCDLHSALFHGSTRQEHHTAAEKIFADAEQLPDRNDSNREQRAHELASLPGHPLYTLTKENEQLETILAQAKEGIDDAEKRMAFCNILRNVSIHYAKKGDLLYPNLSVRYGITGPSNVMWSVDDEIRDTLASLEKKAENIAKRDFEAVIRRMEEMIYKEQNILFPICAASFTEDEWIGIYQDAKDYGTCFNVVPCQWETGEHLQNTPASITVETGEVALPGGSMTIPQLAALLDTIP